MRIRWLISLTVCFLLFAYLGVWLCGFFQESPVEEGDPFVEPEPVQPLLIEPESSSFVPPVTDLDGPLGFELSPVELYPGDFMVLQVYGLEEGAPVSITNPFGEAPALFETDGHLTALIPVKYTFEPGQYLLTAKGGSFNEEFFITVKPKDFPVQHLTVDESVTSETVDSSAANDEYYAKVQPLKSEAEDHPLWDGDFILPLDAPYELTSEFGLVRTVNGQPSDRHGGLDLACERGTPVYAANRGRVLFGEYIALTGNTVCIEHGLGLKTWYYHMDSLNVKTGDRVDKGQQIGTVGSTGFSTGPHLHFAASVYSVYVDPRLLVGSAPEV